MFKNFIDTQALLGPADFDLKRVEVVFGTPNFRNKPAKALWTSTWKDDIANIGWIEWCNYNDYFKMSDLVSGINFTEKGAALGHHWGDEFRSILNAIDCESTVWFNTDWVDHIEKICDNVWELLKEVKE